MKSQEQQEAVIARVQAMFDNKGDREQDAYEKLPRTTKQGKIAIPLFSTEQAAYIYALYEFFYQDHEAKILGRRDNDSDKRGAPIGFIIGE